MNRVYFYFGGVTLVIMTKNKKPETIYKKVHEPDLETNPLKEPITALMTVPPEMEIDLKTIQSMEDMVHGTDPKDRELVLTWLTEQTDGLFKPIAHVG